MNNFARNAGRLSSAGTVVFIGVTAAAAAGQVNWPAFPERSYSVDRLRSSYSAFNSEILRFELTDTTSVFIREVSALYQDLYRENDPLGPEFEAVWDANVDSLYES